MCGGMGWGGGGGVKWKIYETNKKNPNQLFGKSREGQEKQNKAQY